MRAVPLLQTRVVYSERAFAELVVWRLPDPLTGSRHSYKYRLAYIVDGTCVLRFDNEAGKGDHWHLGDRQGRYVFSTTEQLVADFMRAIARWNDANRDT